MAIDIAVLIPHYNDLLGLEKAVRSIHFSGKILVLIVDDGSDLIQKPSKNLMNRWNPVLENKFELIFFQTNKGIEEALNSGLQFILERYKTKYIARMDCGDENLPDRFNRQFTFLEANAEIALLGSAVEVWQNGIHLYNLDLPTGHRAIKRWMFTNNCFIHPTVMFRAECVSVIGLYPKEFPAAEDYAYFFRFLKQYRTANLSERLLKIEKNPSGISLTKRRQQLLSRIKINLENFDWGFFAFWGLARTVILLCLPTGWIEGAKMKYWK